MSSDDSAFALAYAWSAFTGAGAIASGLEALGALGARRPALIINRTVAASPRFADLIGIARRVCDWSEGPPVFQNIRPHTPLSVVIEAAAMLRAHRCDSVVSVGAGSAIDAAKGVVLAVGAEVVTATEWEERLGTHGFSDLAERWTGPVLPHLTIPTTLSSAAHSHAAGITISGEKHLHVDARLGPRLVAFDGELAKETPMALWVSSGIKALDHAVESLYARGLPALIRPWRLDAFATIMNHLYGSASSPVDGRGRAREALLAAAAMSVAGWPSAPLGLSHALGHQAGAQWGMSHGTTSPIFLPTVMAFNAPAADAAFELMANALGAPERSGRSASETVIEAVTELIRALKLPRRLSEVGQVDIAAADLDTFALKVLRDPIMSGNPRVVTERDVLDIVASVA